MDGGLGGAAFTRAIGIKRYTNSRAALIDVNLDSLALMHRNFALENGDSITIYRVPIALTTASPFGLRPNFGNTRCAKRRISDIL